MSYLGMTNKGTPFTTPVRVIETQKECGMNDDNAPSKEDRLTSKPSDPFGLISTLEETSHTQLLRMRGVRSTLFVVLSLCLCQCVLGAVLVYMLIGLSTPTFQWRSGVRSPVPYESVLTDTGSK